MAALLGWTANNLALASIELMKLSTFSIKVTASQIKLFCFNDVTTQLSARPSAGLVMYYRLIANPYIKIKDISTLFSST